jgi:hypothetical protein
VTRRITTHLRANHPAVREVGVRAKRKKRRPLLLRQQELRRKAGRRKRRRHSKDSNRYR